jgi:hypothetical protein
MSESDMTALIQKLQKSNRRWRRLAISLLVIIGLTLPLLTISAAVLRVQAERQARDAQIAAEQARDQAEQARQQQDKVKRAMEAVEGFLKKGLNP